MSLNHRYDFALLFEVKDGNPNGDPDAGNLPRLDAETGHGLVTDVSLKRKVRNYVDIVKRTADGAPLRGHDIFVREKGVLNLQIERAYEMDKKTKEAFLAWQEWEKERKKKRGKEKGEKKLMRPERHYEDLARDWMCQNFYDVRTFGAVMSTGDKGDGEAGESKLRKTAGQVRGPVQLTFARSIDPIVSSEHSITRMAVTNEKDLEKERTMGRKHTVPYGLYRSHGFVSAFLAKQTGFDDTDLDLFFKALEDMFEHDRSAARGEMATRGLIVFKHDSELGNAHAHSLFERVKIKRKEGIEVPRAFSDYELTIDEAGMPAGVKMIRRV
jgi:CRISPR-associated protein Csd2